MSIKDMVNSCDGFDWDEGNVFKNEDKHNVSYSECEQIFFNIPLLIADDFAHGDDEEDRYLALGRTDQNRRLFLVFAIRCNKIRVISARNMTKNERAVYEKAR
jgi:uncharacterized protein